MQHCLLRRITEIDIKEAHVALQAGVCYGAVMVRMLPGPNVRALGALRQAAVRIFMRVYQCNIALVRLFLLIQQCQNAVCARQAHNNHIHLVGHLPDGARKLLCHIQERHYDADAESHAGDAEIGRPRQHQCAAHQRHHHIHDVAHIAQQRHQDIGKTVTVAGIEKDFSVHFVEVCPGGVLMAKHLDNLLPGHHLLHKSFRLSNGDLLAQKILGRVACDIARCKKHAYNAGHHNQAQNYAVVHHDAEHRQQRDARNEHLRQALAYHLAQGVHIIGIITHDVAVAVGIEILDRQVLHMAKHLFAQLFQRALRDNRHQLGVGEARNQAEHIHHHQNAHQPQNAGGHRGPVARFVGAVHNGNDILHKYGWH